MIAVAGSGSGSGAIVSSGSSIGVGAGVTGLGLCGITGYLDLFCTKFVSLSGAEEESSLPPPQPPELTKNAAHSKNIIMVMLKNFLTGITILVAVYNQSFNSLMIQAIRNEIRSYEEINGSLPKPETNEDIRMA